MYNISIRILIFGVNSVTISYLIHDDSLLQSATDVITKRDGYFITKCDRSLLQNAAGFLLQNATVLLQNATVITKCEDFITKCDSYYKMQSLLQTATVQATNDYLKPNTADIRYLEYPLSRTFTIANFLFGSFSILINFPL